MTPDADPERVRTLSDILRSDPWFFGLLEAVAGVAPPDWVVGAGVIRDLVWDRLHGYAERTPPNDVDVAYFDPADLTRDSEREYERRLSERIDVPWDVKNQAAVHLWYARRFGHEIEPVGSILDAVGRFPETATSVAARLEPSGDLTIIAPRGLEDLLEMRLRRNPAQVTEEYYRERIRSKGIASRWPGVEVVYD